MAGPTRRMSRPVVCAEWIPSFEELMERIENAEAEREEALLECEDLRDQVEFTTAECNSLEALLTTTASRLDRAERTIEMLHRQRSRDQEMIRLLEARLAASQAEASNAEEEFRVALEELEVSSAVWRRAITSFTN